MSDSLGFDPRVQLQMLIDAIDGVERKQRVDLDARLSWQRTRYGTNSGPDWARYRDAILERDGDRCRVCGCDDLDCLEVHHIHALARGGNNYPDNLITLCANHHRLAHRGKLSREKLRALVAETPIPDETDGEYVARKFANWSSRRSLT